MISDRFSLEKYFSPSFTNSIVHITSLLQAFLKEIDSTEIQT